MAAEFPNYYSCNIAIGNAATSAVVESLPFKANWLRMLNKEAVDIFVNLKGTLATTKDMIVAACGVGGATVITGVPVGQISLCTTSTSAADKLLRIAAASDAGD